MLGLPHPGKTGTVTLEDLLIATAERDRDSFRALVTKASPILFSVLNHMLRDADQSRDGLQTTFTRIWANAASYTKDRGSAEAWMVQIARNHALDILRKRKRSVEQPMPDFVDAVDPATSAERRIEIRQDIAKLMRCLDGLKENQRDMIRQAYLRGMSYAEIAQTTGTTLNTVRTWLRRGLQALKECVDG